MNIRVISGEFGGRTIYAPAGDRTHPMGERVRGSLFNILGSELQGAEVLDAFAGTGSLGIEALSRGARHATFVERDRAAAAALGRTVGELGIKSRIKVINTTVSNWLDTTENTPQFDFIFADPPYHDVQFSTVTRLMGLLKPGALMVLSHPGRSESPTEPGVVVVDNRSYGNATLTFFRREE